VDYVLSTEPARLFIPKDPLQYRIWSFVTSPFFEYLVFAAICINTVLLAMGFYNQPELYTAFLDVMNLVFTVFFTFEFTVKLAAFGFKEYFADPWNTFDFVIVIGSFLDIGMANLADGGGASISMLRLFRAMRLVKLLAKGESIRQLLYTFIKSFQALPYVALLVALVFFIYGVVGMQAKNF
jgi:voltage-dependent calcium channel L type alpha-1D